MDFMIRYRPRAEFYLAQMEAKEQVVKDAMSYLKTQARKESEVFINLRFSMKKEIKMTRKEAVKIIEKYATPEDMFMDGCAGISDEDIIVIAEGCQKLIKEKEGELK